MKLRLPLLTNAMRLPFVLLSGLALSSVPVRADTEYCNATATDGSGNVEPWNCPSNWDRGLGSSITASGGTLQVLLDNYIWPIVQTAPGLLIQYSGEAATSASGEFVISGGSGTGFLMGTATGDYAAFNTTYPPSFAGVSEAYSSNFVDPCCGLGYSEPTIFSFTFGVPFTLSLSDEMDFYGWSESPSPDSELEDVTSLYATLNIFDSNGSPVPSASISEVPEPSSLVLLVTVAGGIGLMLLRRTLCTPITSLERRELAPARHEARVRR